MSETEYHRALKEVSKLIDKDPLPNSPDGRRLNELANKIMDYEEQLGFR